ncbi:MAG: hypothetical protein KAJ23_08130 [Maribacter sp.]|nr:hypothetical protein [Maribacter sp.]
MVLSYIEIITETVINDLRQARAYIIYIFFILNLGCKTDLKRDSTDMESQRTYELITHLLDVEKENYLIASCISESPRAVSMSMTSDFELYLKKNLGIRDTSHLRNQIRLFKEFRITKELAPSKNIVSDVQFVNFEKQSEKKGFSFWEWLDSNCGSGYCSISKPIFNESYDRAIVQVGTVCGGLCGGGATLIYELIDDEWKEVEIISTWVS